MQYKSYNNTDRSQYDIGTLFIYLLLCLVGVFTIYSSVFNEGLALMDISQPYTKQLIFFGISLFIGVVILYTETNVFFHIGYVVFGIVLLLTLGTFVFGAKVNGAQAWYKIGSIQLQPAELAKLGAVLGLSKFLGTYGIRLDNLINYAIASIFLLVPMGIVLAQNDTGSALVFLSLVLVLYRFGLPGWILGIGVSYIVVFSILMLTKPIDNIWGLQPKFFIAIVLFLIFGFIIYLLRRNKGLLLPLVLLFFSYLVFIFGADYAYNQLKDYQKKRIELIFGLIEDRQGTGYNLFQSKVAIGSGQMTGKGFLEGTQTKLNFVPEPSTDFIFCTLAEETGFLGSAAFVLLYLYFLYRIALMAERQNSRFARAYGYGVFSILLFHFIINIGMTMGMVPTIGIPLPFISYGGSSLLAFTMLLFIFIKLDANRGNEVSIDLR